MRQLNIFEEYFSERLLHDLFRAYYDARRNKRNTINALAFEMNYESNLFKLHDEIISRSYNIRPGICFIIFRPVQREVFAADFRDRIVHHLIYNYISPIFEKTFINDSYSCRKGKGTLYGIKRVQHFIRSCSGNYHKDCYILKLDIKGYFMAMDRLLLYDMVKTELEKNSCKVSFDLPLVLHLIEKVIFNDPTQNSLIKGKRSDWHGLPHSKSLFHAGDNKGLPIGNLTSQLFGNVYLNEFDHFIKRGLGIHHYGRYVDDFVMVHPDKEFLKTTIPLIREYLAKNLLLQLHPDKAYLQHHSKGVMFLGALIKPYRIYVANRTKGNFYECISKWKQKVIMEKVLSYEETYKMRSSINSYLGIMKHFNTFRMIKKYTDVSALPKEVFA